MLVQGVERHLGGVSGRDRHLSGTAVAPPMPANALHELCRQPPPRKALPPQVEDCPRHVRPGAGAPGGRREKSSKSATAPIISSRWAVQRRRGSPMRCPREPPREIGFAGHLAESWRGWPRGGRCGGGKVRMRRSSRTRPTVPLRAPACTLAGITFFLNSRPTSKICISRDEHFYDPI